MLVLSIITYLKSDVKNHQPASVVFMQSVKNFFLKWPLFAASRHKLLSSAAQIFADRWAYMSNTATVSAFLSGCPSLSYNENKASFFLGQTFILDSNRFHVTE